jgi:hypothetical protein
VASTGSTPRAAARCGASPKSRYDRFGSDVTEADGRLYVGTHDGRVLAVELATGGRFCTADSSRTSGTTSIGTSLSMTTRSGR